MEKRSDVIFNGLYVARDGPSRKLRKESHFCSCLLVTAIVVAEAHCIDEWGGEDFQPEYRQLERLRVFTGQRSQ
jgi:superfamily II DNA helicase RecQ